jgi:hypothetical protein
LRFPNRRGKGTKGPPTRDRQPGRNGSITSTPLGGCSSDNRAEPLIVPPYKRRLDQPHAGSFHALLGQYQRLWGGLAGVAGSASSVRWQNRPLGSTGRSCHPGGGINSLGGVEEYRDAAQALRLTTRRAASGRPTALVLLPLRKHDVRFRRLERGVAYRPAFARPRTGLGLGVSSPCGRRLLLARLRGRALSWRRAKRGDNRDIDRLARHLDRL